MTRDQIKINWEQAFRELTRQPLGAKDAVNALPDDWGTTKPSEVVDDNVPVSFPWLHTPEHARSTLSRTKRSH